MRIVKQILSSRIKKTGFLAGIFLLAAVILLKGNALYADAADVKDYSAVFDAAYYSSHYSDLYVTFGKDEKLLFQHFLSYGMKEGRQASEEFNVREYRERYPDLQKAFGDNLPAYYEHYIHTGKAEGRLGRKEVKEPSEEQKFYDHAIFIGDSIINDLRSYAQLQDDTVIKNSTFFTKDDFSLTHAFKPLEDDKTKPNLEGTKYDTWEAVKTAGANRVFLLFGVNDLKSSTPSQVYENYLKLIQKLQKENPEVKIYVISMMPVADGATKGRLNKNTILLLNDMLRKNAPEQNYIYIPMYDSLVDEKGNLMEDYCADGYVHEKQKAYKEKWEKVFIRFAKEQVPSGQ